MNHLYREVDKKQLESAKNNVSIDKMKARNQTLQSKLKDYQKRQTYLLEENNQILRNLQMETNREQGILLIFENIILVDLTPRNYNYSFSLINKNLPSHNFTDNKALIENLKNKINRKQKKSIIIAKPLGSNCSKEPQPIRNK